MDHSFLSQYIYYFVGLMAVLNPVGAVPIFITMTSNQTVKEKKKITVVCSVTVIIILTIALLAGEAVLNFFGISLPSFRVGGGILILLMAISMLHAKISPVTHTKEEAVDSAERESIAIVPLAIPLLAGPGTISTIILYSQHEHTFRHYILLEGIIVIAGLFSLLALRLAPFISARLGKTGINVVTRIMGLIMIALGVEFITNGLKILLPGLAG